MAENRQYNNKPKFQPVMQDATGKLPPRDTEMEEVVLGALMLEKDAYMNVADILTPDAFYDPVNAKIYEAISTLGLNQRPIDMMTVTEQLRANGISAGALNRKWAAPCTWPTSPPACIRPPTSCITPRLSRRSIWRAGS